MLAFGVILLIAGSCSMIYGITQNNSTSAQMRSFLSNGSVNPGTVFIVIGAIAAALGLVLIIISSTKTQSRGTVVKSNVWVCPNCMNSNPLYEPICICGQPKTGTEWRCPTCNTVNHGNIEKCICGTPRNQGSKIKPIVDTGYKSNVEAGSNEWRCPACGRVNANYVGTCGCGQVKPN